MYFDTFDICEAHYLFLSFWHEGQSSDKYRRLSRLTRHFRPRPLLHGFSDLTENGKAIYSTLIVKNRKHL